MKFRAKVSFMNYETKTKANKPSIVTVTVYRKNAYLDPNGDVFCEYKTLKENRVFKIAPHICDLILPPNSNTNVTLKHRDTYAMLSHVDPDVRLNFIFLIQCLTSENPIKGADKERVQHLLHNPFGRNPDEGVTLARRDLVLSDVANYLRTSKTLPTTITSLTIKDSKYRIDGRLFSLRNLNSLTLNNINFKVERDWKSLSNLYKLSHLTALHLTDINLEHLNDQVWNSLPTSLITLNLSNNRLKEVPWNLHRFQKLQTLDISNNQVSFVHGLVCRMQQLHNLNLANNKLEALPANLFCKRRLSTVNVCGNLNCTTTTGNHLFEPCENLTIHKIPTLLNTALATLMNNSLNNVDQLPLYMRAFWHTLIEPCFMCQNFTAFQNRFDGELNLGDFCATTIQELNRSYVRIYAYYCYGCLHTKQGSFHS